MQSETFTLRLTAQQKTKLTQIAAEQGYLHGQKPSINKMIAALADGEFADGSVSIEIQELIVEALISSADIAKGLLLVKDILNLPLNTVIQQKVEQ